MAAVVVIAVFAFALFEPVQVLPRIRLAPGFAFVDQTGDPFTSEDGRGAVTLYSFLPAACGEECDTINRTVADVAANLGQTDFGDADLRFVSVVLDSSDPAVLAEAATAAGADGEGWRFVGGTPDQVRPAVGTGFRVFYEGEDRVTDFDPTFVIVDGNGLIRGEYRYASLIPESERLTRHLDLLATEIREADGPTALVYEAAHIFLCYP